MSVFDFDSGVNGEYVEQLVVGEYAYYKTPLRASSGNEVGSTLQVDRATGTFTSTALGSPVDNPSVARALPQSRVGTPEAHRV